MNTRLLSNMKNKNERYWACKFDNKYIFERPKRDDNEYIDSLIGQ